MNHFSWPVDGSIVGLYLLATMAAGLMVRRYVRRVEDFLVAGREMNVYLGIASLAAYLLQKPFTGRSLAQAVRTVLDAPAVAPTGSPMVHAAGPESPCFEPHPPFLFAYSSGDLNIRR